MFSCRIADVPSWVSKTLFPGWLIRLKTAGLAPEQLTRMTVRNTILLALAVWLCALSAEAQGTGPSTLVCPKEIPPGVQVAKLPDAEQLKVTVSDFSVSTSKDSASYDLAMQIKNGTADWCVTSLALAYSLGDARGQEWIAYEYPAVKRFTMKLDSPKPSKEKESSPSLAAHSVGLSPGQTEKRTVFDVYDYIQPRPTESFDGFHIISAEIKSCMGYQPGKTK
jgi:hypothetical protein